MKTGVAVLLTLGCATMAFAAERDFRPVAQSGQTIAVVDGQQVAVALGTDSAVSLAYSPEGRDAGWLDLRVENQGTEPVAIANDAVSAHCGAARLRTASDAELRQDQSAAAREIGAILAAGPSGYGHAAAHSPAAASTATASRTAPLEPGATRSKRVRIALPDTANPEPVMVDLQVGDEPFRFVLVEHP